MENPMDRAKGKNRDPGIPVIVNAGANTARIHNKINSFGRAISLQASQIANALGLPISRCWCIFSIVTVLSSTRMPIASANPLSDIRLIVCPNSFRKSTPEITEIGIVRITIKAALRSPKNNKTIRPVSIAPIAPSVIKLLTELMT
ncbi:hypothetical protein D3C86_969870 [compost metagenome]